MSDIEWKDPPPSTRPPNRVNMKKFVAALKANPGKWAVYGQRGSNTNISNHHYAQKGVQWRRVTEDGVKVIYARWVGGVQTPWSIAEDLIDSFRLALESGDDNPLQTVTDYAINRYGED